MLGGGALSAGGESGPCFGELGAGLLFGLQFLPRAFLPGALGDAWASVLRVRSLRYRKGVGVNLKVVGSFFVRVHLSGLSQVVDCSLQ